jgi:hypothetical protein
MGFDLTAGLDALPFFKRGGLARPLKLNGDHAAASARIASSDDSAIAAKCDSSSAGLGVPVLMF